MKKAILIILLLSTYTFAIGQISIAPTNLFINSSSKFGTYLVINNSNAPQEVSIDFLFAYGETNTDGQLRFVTDSTIADHYSIADYIKAFPRNFTLQPEQRQVIRLRVNAPNNLENGTYWCRISTSSTPVSPPIVLQATNNVTASVGITIEQITGLFYKVGNVNTGLNVKTITPEINPDEDTLEVTVAYKRIGNSPLLGTITTSLVNSSNDVVSQKFMSTTIYFDGYHKQAFNIKDIESGKYTVEVEFKSSRGDVSPSDIIQMQPVTKTVTITIP